MRIHASLEMVERHELAGESTPLALLKAAELAVVGEAAAILGRIRDNPATVGAVAGTADLGYAVLMMFLDHTQHPPADDQPADPSP